MWLVKNKYLIHTDINWILTGYTVVASSATSVIWMWMGV